MEFDVVSYITSFITNIDFYGLILPLLVYTFLIAAYGIVVWSFYKSASKRDLFRLEIKSTKGKWKSRIFYGLKYVILFPVLAFLWFAVLSSILFFISKTQSTQTILLISMAMMAAVRISAYYREELSQEIAKILPLAVLGIFVVDPGFFSFSVTISKFYETFSLGILLANYLLFAIVLEFVLRALLYIIRGGSHAVKTQAIKIRKAPQQDKKVEKNTR
jgi:hypothetical protein